MVHSFRCLFVVVACVAVAFVSAASDNNHAAVRRKRNLVVVEASSAERGLKNNGEKEAKSGGGKKGAKKAEPRKAVQKGKKRDVFEGTDDYAIVMSMSMSMPARPTKAPKGTKAPDTEKPTKAPNSEVVVITIPPTPSPPTIYPTPSPPISAPSAVDACLSTNKVDYLDSVLTKITDELLLKDTLSPQGQAYAWMLSDSTFVCSINVAQRYALATIYYSTTGTNWTDNSGWLSNGTECDWTKVTCGVERDVTGLALSENNLQGTIPKELTTLTTMTIFEVYDNSLYGTIPPLNGLVSLQTFDVEFNMLTGQAFPSGLIELVSLVSYRVSTNFLMGTIAAEMGQLSTLHELWVAENRLAGTIPLQIFALPALTSLLVHYNTFTGSIPTDIGLTTALVEFYAYGNALTGVIPNEIYQLTTLKEILLDRNSLIGTISEDLGNLVFLEDLRLNDNDLIGTIPRSVGKLTGLRNLVLSNNTLVGDIPDVFTSSSSLKFFDMTANMLTGTFPSSIFANPDALEIVYVRNNQLSGPLPLFAAPLLRDLYVSDNAFTGTIPKWTDLPALNELLLQGNALTGSVPASVCALQSQSLEDLWSDCISEILCECCTRCF